MSLLSDLSAYREEVAAKQPPKCGVARFAQESGIDIEEIDALYAVASTNEIHALLVRRGFGLQPETIKRHSPLRTTGITCPCHSQRS